MGFKKAQDIFNEKEKEERAKELEGIGGMFNNMVKRGMIVLHPVTEKKIQDFLDWDSRTKKEEFEKKKRFEVLGYLIGTLITIVATLGSIWLIKFFWRGIFR